MSKASKTIVAAIGLMTLTTGGCAVRRNDPPDVLDPTPVAVDAAMERRNWDQSHALYANTGTIAGNTGFFFMADATRPEWQNGFAEPFIFLTNVALMPISLIITPPFAPVEYRAATIEPTYSGNPPLPDIAAPAGDTMTPPPETPGQPQEQTPGHEPGPAAPSRPPTPNPPAGG